MPLFRPQAAAILTWAAFTACGGAGGPAETAALGFKTSGGDEVISEDGPSVGAGNSPSLAAPVQSRDDYRLALTAAKAHREKELGQIPQDQPRHTRLAREVQAIESKLRNVDLAYLQQRNAFVLCERAMNTFVFQFAADREWEMTYAMRSGDLGLASSILQDVMSRFDAAQGQTEDHVDIPEEGAPLSQETDAAIRDMAANRLMAETLAAEALLKLAQLAIEASDFGEAERQFRTCLNYESDLGVRSDALNGYAALLELLGRGEEARKVDSIAARSLNIAR